jgi:4-hydroxybenzoate polyprenyltransferase
MKLLRAIIYSNSYVAFVLGILTLSSYALVENIEWRLYTVICVFLGSFILYNFHRLYKIDFIPEDQLSERHQWVLKRANPLKISMGLSLFVMMLLLPNFNADTIVCLIPAGLISVGYTIPIVPTETGWRRLRDIPFTKPLIISLVVGYLTLAFPVFEQWGFSELKHPVFVKLFAERMLFLLAVTIPFDMRDLLCDKASGLETLATEFGFVQTRNVGLIALLAWLLMLVWRLIALGFSWPQMIFGFVMFGYLLVCYLLTNPKRQDLFYILAFEGSIILYSLGWLLI